MMEELDYPGEFFFNGTTKEFFLSHNGTGAPAETTSFEVPHRSRYWST